MNDLSESKNPQDRLLLVNTLDGQLHGIDQSTGQKLWTISDGLGSMVQVIGGPKETQDIITPLGEHVSADEEDDGIFIPELSGGVGHLYYYGNQEGDIKVKSFTEIHRIRDYGFLLKISLMIILFS